MLAMFYRVSVPSVWSLPPSVAISQKPCIGVPVLGGSKPYTPVPLELLLTSISRHDLAGRALVPFNGSTTTA